MLNFEWFTAYCPSGHAVDIVPDAAALALACCSPQILDIHDRAIHRAAGSTTADLRRGSYVSVLRCHARAAASPRAAACATIAASLAPRCPSPAEQPRRLKVRPSPAVRAIASWRAPCRSPAAVQSGARRIARPGSSADATHPAGTPHAGARPLMRCADIGRVSVWTALSTASASAAFRAPRTCKLVGTSKMSEA